MFVPCAQAYIDSELSHSIEMAGLAVHCRYASLIGETGEADDDDDEFSESFSSRRRVRAERHPAGFAGTSGSRAVRPFEAPEPGQLVFVVMQVNEL